MAKINKNDFIEIEFTGKLKDTGEIFDTNKKKDAKKLGKEPKPYIMAVGHGMLIKGLDDELIGKETGKEYTSEFPPEKAFGKRRKEMVKMIPMRAFQEQNIMPRRGMQLSLDGQLVRILSASGGRVLVDFNNPLAGKDVIYEYKINKKIDDLNEKINALQDFFFRKQFDFNVKDKTIEFYIPEKQKQLQQFVKLMEKGFKDILGMNVEVKPEKSKQEPENKNNTQPQ
ncbi:MAG: FKBP-type peptidyl-prolyl cis-trans isomerase [Candidatus Nanoarchaeia archaeon]